MISQAMPDSKVTIALDGMGGDHAPESVIRGAEQALKQYSNLSFLLCGNEARFVPILERCPRVSAACQIIHTSEVVSNDDKASTALRRGMNSSMGLAIKAVRDGAANGVVSAGNTGALMAISKILLGTLPGIDRPAIGGILPTKRSHSVMLDLGANVTCDANNLFEFAVMGEAFARALFGIKKPSIGILNIGTEDIKGNEAVRTAAGMLRESENVLNFHGYIEGCDIGEGKVDVVVTDGFSGNIALKTAEGTARMCGAFLKDALRNSLLSRLGSLLIAPAMSALKVRLDPRTHNGAMFLGLNGIVVKSHGGMDEAGFAKAISVAVELSRHRINDQILKEMVESGHIPPEEYTQPKD